MKVFTPKVSRTVFKEVITLEKEGSFLSGYINNQIISKLSEIIEKSFYDSFITLCKHYSITHNCFFYVDKLDSRETFKIVIYKENLPCYEMIYYDKKQDITEAFANKLKTLLYSQINNEIFIKAAKQNNH